MTHERCSELLHEHVRGELPRELADAVSTHLAECPDCAAEQRVVAALAGPETPKLEDLERARLHRALAQELFAAPANADVAGASTDPRWRRWIAPGLGAAAAVLVALLVVTGGVIGGGDDGETANVEAGGAGVTGEERESATADDVGAGAGGSKPRRGGKGEELSAASGAATNYDSDPGGAQAEESGPQPEFYADAGELSAESLSSVGRTSALFQQFSDRYTLEEVGALREPFLRRLAASAGGASGQVRRCAATLPADEPVLPAYGATGSYEGRDAIVLGFVTNDAGTPALDRYLMWVWAKGSCRQPIDTLFERIAP